jgi:dTDP-4-amino-4,6-dideoxygalactose transaminase
MKSEKPIKVERSPYQVTKDFEQALCDYTGARYTVAVNSGTAAILLALKWHRHHCHDWKWVIDVPKHTYVSVPCAVIQAEFKINWTDDLWRGEYQFKHLPVWDSARRFTSGMFRPSNFQCLSFATTKILGIEQGGAILHDNEEADSWFRRMRFDGRTEGVDPRDDTFTLIGHHCIMLPSIAAQLILKLHHTPKHNDDMPDYPYPDLSKAPAFKEYAR